MRNCSVYYAMVIIITNIIRYKRFFNNGICRKPLLQNINNCALLPCAYTPTLLGLHEKMVLVSKYLLYETTSEPKLESS